MPPVAASPLLDLPAKCLHLVACSLTPTAAGRLRTTCTGLQQVVDAAWEPCEAPVPPHRRSVPLTLEEVEAQTPPPRPQRQGASEGAYDYDPDCCTYAGLLGPALTELTAHQAVNVLQGQELVGCLTNLTKLRKHHTVQEKMAELELLTFHDLGVTWPPAYHPRAKTHRVWLHGRCGPADPGKEPSPFELPSPPFVTASFDPDYEPPMVTDDTSARDATAEEVQQFFACGPAPDGCRFDARLFHGNDKIRVFLQPTEPGLGLRASADVVAA